MAGSHLYTLNLYSVELEYGLSRQIEGDPAQIHIAIGLSSDSSDPARLVYSSDHSFIAVSLIHFRIEGFFAPAGSQGCVEFTAQNED